MVNSLWFKWKSLRLPWRNMFLVGQDLAGNTFWEFRATKDATRLRRIVKFDPRTHYADVKVTPQWHQWLRYARDQPPSIEEQQQDLIRQAQIKQLARLADERWASKPSFLDKPKTQQPAPPLETSHASPNATQENIAATAQDTPAPQEPTAQPEPASAETKTKKSENPWDNATNPGDSWQPESWTPTSKR